MKTAKRITSLLLAVALAFSLAASCFAGDTALTRQEAAEMLVQAADDYHCGVKTEGYSKGVSGRQSGPARHAHPRAGARDAGPRVRRTARAGRRSCPHGGRHAGLFRRARVGRRGAFARAFFRYRRRRSGRTAAPRCACDPREFADAPFARLRPRRHELQGRFL